MHLSINCEFEKIHDEDNILLLKNKRSDSIIKISKTEYILLESYSNSQSLTDIHKKAILNGINVSSEYISDLLKKAKEIKLLIDDKELSKLNNKEGNKTINYSPFILVLLQIMSLFIKFLNKNNIRVKSEFAGSFRFYKLISFDISKNYMSLFFDKRVSRYFILVFFSIIMSFIIYSVITNGCLINRNLISETLFYNVTLNKYVLFFTVVAGLLITSVFHEVAHYFVYKQLGGKFNEFGLALMYYSIPVVYASTNSIYFWKENWKKIFVSSAGIISDIFFICFTYSILVLNNSVHSSNIRFISFLLMICLIFRTSFNLNFLIPGTDGYYIFVDLLKRKNLFFEARKSTMIILNSIIKVEISQITLIRFLYMLYFLLSWICVIFLLLSFLIFAIYPLISEFFLKLFL